MRNIILKNDLEYPNDEKIDMTNQILTTFEIALHILYQ